MSGTELVQCDSEKKQRFPGDTQILSWQDWRWEGQCWQGTISFPSGHCPYWAPTSHAASAAYSCLSLPPQPLLCYQRQGMSCIHLGSPNTMPRTELQVNTFVKQQAEEPKTSEINQGNFLEGMSWLCKKWTTEV